MIRSKPPESAGSKPPSAPAGPAADLDELPTQLEAGDSGSGRLVDGRLQLLEALGEGGMGTVWKARDVRLGRIVALKRPKGAMLTAEGRARFMREAQACARLAHPNIITIYTVGEDAEGPFLEMEYVAGSSLRDMVRAAKGGLDEKFVREVGIQMCGALALAHAHGIIHRDIKPANILLTPQGTAKLGDFGLAAAGEDMAAVTTSGAVMGTMFYASPEQLRDTHTADARSDVYSLGATLYFALTGEDPRVIRLEKVPAGIRPVLQKALEEGPAARYADMGSFEKALALRPPVLPPPKPGPRIEPKPPTPEGHAGGPDKGFIKPPPPVKKELTPEEAKKKKRRKVYAAVFFIVLIGIAMIQQANENEQRRRMQTMTGKNTYPPIPEKGDGGTPIGPYTPPAPPLGSWSSPPAPPRETPVNVVEVMTRANTMFSGFNFAVQQRFMMLPSQVQYLIGQGLMNASAGNFPLALICYNQASSAASGRDPISIFLAGWCNFFLGNTANFNSAMATVRQLDSDGTLAHYVDESLAISQDMLKASSSMDYSNLGFGSFK